MSAVGRRRLWWLLRATLAVAVILVASGSWMLWRHTQQAPFNDKQRMSIPGADGPAVLESTPPLAGKREGAPFVTSVSGDGRYFLDQYGKPILVAGDSPWALMTRLSPQQAGLWFADRQSRGINAAIVSLIGATANGAPGDDGATFDGLLPFANGDILQWQEPYWERATEYLRMAADHGMTVMLYPIDGWTIGHSFVPSSIEQCREYGGKLAQRFRDLPNIVWMSGGDYVPSGADPAHGSDVDRCIDAMMHGIREAGDRRIFSIQLYPQSTSTRNPFWAERVDFNFVYTYFPTYAGVLNAYRRDPPIPAVLGEANYEGENNQPGTPPTTDETLRRQVLWALTSGVAGEFAGSDDWEFHEGWEQRLSTRSLTQIARLRSTFAALTWWQLVPDLGSELVTGGRGTQLMTDDEMDAQDVLDSDYVTAARTPDGTLAVVYVPTQRTISVNVSEMAAGTHAEWIDPASGTRLPVPMSDTFTTPGRNADGDDDWLLILAS